jgi:hypothetical protein
VVSDETLVQDNDEAPSDFRQAMVGSLVEAQVVATGAKSELDISTLGWYNSVKATTGGLKMAARKAHHGFDKRPDLRAEQKVRERETLDKMNERAKSEGRPSADELLQSMFATVAAEIQRSDELSTMEIAIHLLRYGSHIAGLVSGELPSFVLKQAAMMQEQDEAISELTRVFDAALGGSFVVVDVDATEPANLQDLLGSMVKQPPKEGV